MARRVRKPLPKCSGCKKVIRHPNVYAGRCEDCYSNCCLHDDSVNRRPRKSAGGYRIDVHLLKGGNSDKMIGAVAW